MFWGKEKLKFVDAALLSVCLKAIIVNDLNEFGNMEKMGHRYVVQHFHLKDLSPTNINVELDSTLEESTPWYTTTKEWVSD